MCYVEKGSDTALAVSKTGKTQITALFGFSANGYVFRPHILYDGKRMSAQIRENLPEDVTVDMSESGWMTGETFSRWLELIADELRRQGVQTPVILLLDGHSSHDTIDVRRKAYELGIKIIILIPRRTYSRPTRQYSSR